MKSKMIPAHCYFVRLDEQSPLVGRTILHGVAELSVQGGMSGPAASPSQLRASANLEIHGLEESPRRTL